MHFTVPEAWDRRAVSAALVVAVLCTACSGRAGSGPAAPLYTVTVAPEGLEFRMRLGERLPAPQTLTATYSGDGLVVGTPLGTSLPDWLSVTTTSAYGKTVTLTLAITLNAPVSVGAHATTLRLLTGRADGTNVSSVDVPVSLTVADTLVVSPTQVALTANDEVAGQVRQVEVRLGSGGGVAWTATAEPGVKLSGAAGAAGEPLVLSYDLLAQPLPPGAATRSVTVSAVVDGEPLTRTVQVALDVGVHRIWARRSGVALTSVPGVSVLDATVDLVDNAGVTTGTWSATSDQPWLRVEGIVGDRLALHADPAGLPDGMHYGAVTIASTGPRIEGPEQVRVGLFVGSVAPVEGVLATGIGGRIVPDPVRPWVWLIPTYDRIHVHAYNVYTGALEAQLTLPAEAVRVAISGDGRTLYGGGVTTSGGGYTLTRMSLDTGEVLPAFAGDGYGPVRTIRPGGREFVVTGAGGFYDAATGTRASPTPLRYDGGWELAASADQRFLYAISNAISPKPFARFRLKYEGATPTLKVTQDAGTSINGLGTGRLAVLPDGSAACFPDHRSGTTGDGFRVWGPGPTGSLVVQDGFTGSVSTDYTIAIEVGRDGRAVALSGATLDRRDAIASPWASSTSLPDKAEARDLTLSSDGERAIATGATDHWWTTEAVWVYRSR